MTTIEHELIDQIHRLDETQQQRVLAFVRDLTKPARQPRKAGSAEGQVKMADDFDAPLPDFDEYMP